MSIIVNGRQIDLPETIQNVKGLLSHYNLENRIVVVEVNKDIVMKQNYETTGLSNGDIVEIIHFVGG
ncbi:sulfur carrier protein ThiS [Neobacillus bataviensis LMG 21833]|uniref:Sulfur carrier protein ThiS n=1 Tax=Neobacillus bataviensis LMG 21833 TaxID=1117379 RepID=K6CJX8_9BACI|nr:sulfur carrier protein ThiS [Neobacillus bataviensis]EKN71465.1 sulfur carrier protein ThiS [Neobacillus bataviensis LMG 21833]